MLRIIIEIGVFFYERNWENFLFFVDCRSVFYWSIESYLYLYVVNLMIFLVNIFFYERLVDLKFFFSYELILDIIELLKVEWNFYSLI